MKPWEVMVAALGWVLVIEGLLPLTAPEVWKKAVSEIARARPETLRAAGAVFVAAGVTIVLWMTG